MENTQIVTEEPVKIISTNAMPIHPSSSIGTEDVIAVIWIGDLPAMEFAKLYDMADEYLEGLILDTDDISSGGSFTSLNVFQSRVFKVVQNVLRNNKQAVKWVKLRYRLQD